MRRHYAAAVLLTLAGATPAAGQGQPAHRHVVWSRADVVHLLNRTAYGPRPGDVERVLILGLDGYLDAQLHPNRLADSDANLYLRRLHVLEMSTADLRETYQAGVRARRERQRRGAGDSAATRPEVPEMRPTGMRRYLAEFQQAALARAILSKRQLYEVLVDFWTNHFNVFVLKGPVRFLMPSYIEDVIRRHALGSFEDLLIATAQSPAMLVYLDNAQSVAPNAEPPQLERMRRRAERMTPRRAAQRARLDSAMRRLELRMPRGINENYARELLELHTLGVDGGYTQDDVMHVARILTGWGVQQRPGTVRFVFNDWAHDRGEKLVLGHVFPPGRGEREGLELLRMLARHPSTMRFVSTKLCRRFVADDPPAACIDTAVQAWVGSGGDIGEVIRAILTSPSFWAPEYRTNKVKTPLEFVASAARVTGSVPDTTLALVRVVARLGQPLFQESAPTGYPDRRESWVNAGALLQRFHVALAIAGGRAPGLQAPREPPLGSAGTADEILAGVRHVFFHDVAGAATLQSIRNQISDLPDPRARRTLAMGMAIGSPEFQRR